jgi:anti-anti-sigma factor
MAFTALSPPGGTGGTAGFAGTVGPPRSSRFRPVVLAEGPVIVVLLRGEADVSTKLVLCDVLSRVIASGAGDVVIDLAETSFIDAGAGRVLATAQQLLDPGNRRLTFRSPSRLALRVLDVFGLAGLVEARKPVPG